MRTMFTALAFVVFAGALTATAADRYESKEGKYGAKFPGDEKPKSVSQKAGGLDLNITIVEKGKGGFAVIYSDMPADVVKAAPAAKLLEGGEKGLVDNFKAKVTKSGETKFKSGDKEYPARDILAEKDDLNLRVTIILVDNRLYQVFVVGPKDMVTGKDADDFFKSFELTK
ncbi:MAG: hypothetical protein ACKODX_18210 [Gemmata sp.]